VSSASSEELKAATKKVRGAYNAVAFLCSANGKRYQPLLDYLLNSFLSGCDKYPKTVVEVYDLLTHWKGTNTLKVPVSNGVSFTTDDEMEVFRKKNKLW